MKNQLNKELIESLNESNNDEFIRQINEMVTGMSMQVVNDIAQKSPFVKVDKCVILPVNEAYLGTFTQLSEFTYFLGIENPQIEFNSKSKSKVWKYMWSEFKANFRLGKRKYREIPEYISNEPITRYKLTDFRHDFVSYMSEYLSESSLIYEFYDHISMIGQDDFGTNVKINIYFCAYDKKNDVFKLIRENRSKLISVTFADRFKNLEQKINSCGRIFVDMIKIFNAIYSANYSRVPNQILLESMLYNCPDILFNNDDVYKTFINVANYIRLANPNSLTSICTTDKTIFEENLITAANCQVDYSKILNMLDRFKN